MQSPSKIILFGDQNIDLFTSLSDLFKNAKTTLLLTNFLDKACKALRRERAALPKLQRAPIPDFATLAQLLEKHKDTKGTHAAVNSALLCIAQLGQYIRFRETHPDEDIQDAPILGLCTGMLAGAAVASSQSLPHLIPLAVECVCVAFRVGLEAQRRVDNLEPNTESSWSTVVGTVDSVEIPSLLENFCKNHSFPHGKEVYVSAVDATSVTVSGPPSSQRLLFDSLRQTKKLSLPIYAPYHAQHLQAPSPETIFPAQSSAILEKAPVHGKLFSTSTGLPIEAKTCRQLLEVAVHDILQEPIYLKKLYTELCAALPPSNEWLLYPFCTNGLASAFKTNPELKIKIQETGAAEGPERNTGLGSEGKSTKIAIVGMAGRFPGSSNLQDYWKVLEAGLDLHKKVPKDRFNVDTHFDATGAKKNTTLTPYGCFMDNPGLFDAAMFNMSPREAAQTDPMQRLALVTAYEALEMAGYVPNRTPSTNTHRIGTFFGQASDDWREVNSSANIDTYYITGGIRAFVPGRLNYFYKWEGPSYSVDTACSSSLAAVQIACSALTAGECDTAVAGGVNVLTNPDIFAGLSRGFFLSKTGSCKTFDNDADGYCRSDAVGTIILKRLDDAIADNDNIQAVILGAATNQSAEAVSITHPHAETQERLYKHMLDKAGVDPADIDFVEMHGTGTQAGDANEMKSVINVFTPNRKRDRPVYVGAVKANLGHAEAASGVSAIIKCLLMLRHNAIPMHVGIKKSINTHFPPLDPLNIKIAHKQTEFRQSKYGKRKIIVNNFSAAGGNTTLLIEEAPKVERDEDAVDPRDTHVVALSAKTTTSLMHNVERMIRYLSDTPEVSLADLAYTTTARRMHYPFRKTFVGSNIEEIKSGLNEFLSSGVTPAKAQNSPAAFVFTGQGSHYIGMGQKLYETSEPFRADLLQFETICAEQHLPGFIGIVDGSATIESLSPVQVQLGLAALEIALARLWMSWGVVPQVVVGHSLGEYAALCIANVLSISEALYLVGRRAAIMVEECQPGTHAMLAVKLSAGEVDNAIASCKQSCEFSCMNSMDETVISGPVEEIETIAATLTDMKIRNTKLNVPFAFHSAQVQAILAKFETVASGATFRKPTIPVASSVLGELVTEEGTFNAKYLCRHAREPVNFIGAVDAATSHCTTIPNGHKTAWLEIGPHPVCVRMIKASLCLSSLRKGADDSSTLTNTIASLYGAGVPFDWSEFHKPYVAAHRLLELPTYAFDEKNYWLQYSGDWTLTRGQAVQAQAPPPRSSFSTTSLQQIESEVFKDDEGEVVFSSDLSEPLLCASVTGHLVNGVGLVPSSLWADMALTAASYIHSRLRPGEKTPALSCGEMLVPNTCLSKWGKEPQPIRITAKGSLRDGRVSVRIVSLDGKATKDHAECVVTYGDAEAWLAEWEKLAYLVESRMDYLTKGEETGEVDRLQRGMAYKLFSVLVNYDGKYRGIEQVKLHTQHPEASAKVRFQYKENDGKFMYSPYAIDSIGHLSGLVINAGPTSTDSTVYISHGWDNLRLTEPFSTEKTYQTYVRMQRAGPKMMAGDVYCFDQGKIVAVFGGLKFTEMQRSVLQMLLPSPKKGASPAASRPSPAAASKPAASKPAASSKRPAPKQKASPKAQSSGPSELDKIMQVIVEEVGVEPSDLTNDTAFADIGVDSLLSLSILGRLREICTMDFSNNLFLDYETVGSLKAFVAEQSPEPRSVTPVDDSSDSDSVHSATDSTTSTAPTVPTPATDDTVELFRATIAEELGMDCSEIVASTNLAELGLDSLMSLSILGSLREKVDVNLPNSFFQDNQTFGEIQQFLAPEPVEAPTVVAAVAPKRQPKARNPLSVLLQGKPSPDTPSLFLLPDGSGSAAVYSNMPDFGTGVAVYGLNSPYLSNPKDFDVGVEGIAKIWLDEIRGRQPHGPYILGGWSFGGMAAYEVAYQLIQAGEEVKGMILVDSPCPVSLPPLPISLVEFIASTGLFGAPDPKTGGMPAWLVAHFDSAIKNLMRYKPRSIEGSKRPPTITLWARDGVCKNPEDRRPDLPEEDMNGTVDWLLNNRSDMGPNGWDALLNVISGGGVPGNHFSMMKRPQIDELSVAVNKAFWELVRPNGQKLVMSC